MLVEGILVEQLKRYRTNPEELNGALIQTLNVIGSEIGAPVIEEALASGQVDMSFLEDWDEAAVDDEEDSHDHEHDHDEPIFLLPGISRVLSSGSSKKDAAKKKAKRKQAAKSRKMSRKKRR